MKKITYLAQRYRPDREATSKEVNLLFRHFPKSVIYNLHLDGYFKFKCSKYLISHHFIYYPFSFPFLYIFSQKRIIHIYTSLCDRPYLPLLPKKNMILTSTNYFPKEQIKKRISHLLAAQKIVVEAEIQKKELLNLNIPAQKIELIYPPVNLKQFSYQEALGIFTILNASCPGKIKDLKKRGIFLLLDTDHFLKETLIKLSWRGGEFNLFQRVIKDQKLKNISIENKIHTNMNDQYGQVHCTIIPYLYLDEYLKLIPNSAVESLAAGKPLLVSSQTGIAEIVKKNVCGVVFEPNTASLLAAIAELKKNYKKYHKNCRRTAENFFDQEKFIQKYQQLYNQI